MCEKRRNLSARKVSCFKDFSFRRTWCSVVKADKNITVRCQQMQYFILSQMQSRCTYAHKHTHPLFPDSIWSEINSSNIFIFVFTHVNIFLKLLAALTFDKQLPLCGNNISPHHFTSVWVLKLFLDLPDIMLGYGHQIF